MPASSRHAEVWLAGARKLGNHFTPVSCLTIATIGSRASRAASRAGQPLPVPGISPARCRSNQVVGGHFTSFRVSRRNGWLANTTRRCNATPGKTCGPGKTARPATPRDIGVLEVATPSRVKHQHHAANDSHSATRTRRTQHRCLCRESARHSSTDNQQLRSGADHEAAVAPAHPFSPCAGTPAAIMECALPLRRRTVW